MKLDAALPRALLLRKLHRSSATHRDRTQRVLWVQSRPVDGVAAVAEVHCARGAVVAVALDYLLVAQERKMANLGASGLCRW